MRLLSLLCFLLFSCFTTPSFAQLTTVQIDSVVNKTMTTFNVPGMAVAVVKDGKTVHQNAYGIRSVKTQKPVTLNTLFGIASNTKAFTTAAIAQLVDAEKLSWDTKVTDIIPEFKLYDPYVTSEFTVRDLVTHRSGLGLGAGDLMIFPAANKTSLSQLIHNLRYLKPVSSFRSEFAYDNLLYIVAGEIITRVSGENYTDYIQKHFFDPLQMKRATLDIAEIEKDRNRIDGHVPVDGQLQIAKPTFTSVALPAGGIYASIQAMTKWVKVRLNNGRYGKALQDSLFSAAQAHEMWTPQTLISTGSGTYNTHFSAYGLGWFLKDVNGYLQVSHTGGLMGIVSQVTLLPELDLGIVVLTNQQSGAAFTAITNTIKDAYFGIENKNRIATYHQAVVASKKRADSISAAVTQNIDKQLQQSTKKWQPEQITGVYKDPWFGKVKIEQNKAGQLRFKALRSPDLVGDIYFYKGTTYVVRWDNPTLKANAFVIFSMNTEVRADGFTMKAISPLTDFSFDFQDLNFTKIQ